MRVDGTNEGGAANDDDALAAADDPEIDPEMSRSLAAVRASLGETR